MSQSQLDRGLDRRNVLVAGAALVGTAAIPDTAFGATEPGLAPAGDLLAAVRKFTGGLEPDKLKAASFAWNGPEWQSWNYFGIGGFTKPGLRLEQMSAAQKEAAWGIVGVLMSPAGLAKTRNVMLLQDILAASGNRASERSSERFSFSVFGTPAETGAWGFRLEGHHLTHSIAVRDNRIVSVTPASFSALPNRVTGGKHAGLVTLRDEEALARRLMGDLAPKLQARARASDPRSATSCPMPAASAAMFRRSASLPPSSAPRSATCSGSSSRPSPSSTCRRCWRPRSERVSGRGIARPLTSPGTAPTRRRRRSATASSATASSSSWARWTRRRSTCTRSTMTSATCWGGLP